MSFFILITVSWMKDMNFQQLSNFHGNRKLVFTQQGSGDHLVMKLCFRHPDFAIDFVEMPRHRQGHDEPRLQERAALERSALEGLRMAAILRNLASERFICRFGNITGWQLGRYASTAGSRSTAMTKVRLSLCRLFQNFDQSLLQRSFHHGPIFKGNAGI
ncbi:hypothetical protein LIT32_27175 (plasmid) [Bacillus sp. CMF21]|nr:hypothetical protein LIT32_27175 [Bacillus sp. CMF21]